jgi:hypothetical protein
MTLSDQEKKLQKVWHITNYIVIYDESLELMFKINSEIFLILSTKIDS